MPYVTVQMLAGRSIEQKRELAKEITDSLAKICNAKPEGVYVGIEDVEIPGEVMTLLPGIDDDALRLMGGVDFGEACPY